MTDIEKVDIKDRVPLGRRGADRDDLMVNWMRAIISLSGKRLFAEGISHPGGKRHPGEERKVCGEKTDPDRHEINKEIIGIAYQSRMQKTGTISGPHS